MTAAGEHTAGVHDNLVADSHSQSAGGMSEAWGLSMGMVRSCWVDGDGLNVAVGEQHDLVYSNLVDDMVGKSAVGIDVGCICKIGLRLGEDDHR